MGLRMPQPLEFHASVHSPGAFPGDPAPYAGSDCLTFMNLRLRDADGFTGHGFTGRFLAREVAVFLNHTVAPALPATSDDPVGVLM